MNEGLGSAVESSQFDLVSAGQEFLLAALPLERPESQAALDAFVTNVPQRELPRPVLDVVLLRILTVLQRHAANALPTRVERYLDLEAENPDPMSRFKRCVDELLARRAIRHKTVKRAVEYIHEHLTDPRLSQRCVAQALRITRPYLSGIFRKAMGVRVREYVKRERLDLAAALLVEGHKSIKEVWAAVGYDYASNFDHDFHARFSMTPTEYRGRAVVSYTPRSPAPKARATPTTPRSLPGSPQETAPASRPVVLIVEDSEGMRDTIGHFLSTLGYKAITAATGQDGLRLAASNLPRAILLDYRLPDLNGIECLRQLRAAPTTRRAAVALVTADWEVEDSKEEVRSLDAMIVMKPIDLDAVARTVATMCTRMQRSG